MIFEALDRLYDRLALDETYLIAPPGRSVQKISFKIVLHRDGRLHELQDAKIERDGRLVPRQVLVLGAAKPSGSGLNPCFLWDNETYLLGLCSETDAPKAEKAKDRARLAFSKCRELHDSIRAHIDNPSIDAVCAFLNSWDPDSPDAASALQRFTPAGFGVFQIVGEKGFVHEDPAIQAWWTATSEAAEGEVGQCLVSGGVETLARLHPKIKGVIGAQSAGATIAGFNDDAYCSWGLTQSLNAPVSVRVAERYTTALNALLDGPQRERHRRRLGDGQTTMVFWTEEPSPAEDIFAELLGGPSLSASPEAQDEGLRLRMAETLRAITTGTAAPESAGWAADDRYHILGLAPNAARISVRFHHRNTLGSLLESLRAHHSAIHIVDTPPEQAFPPVWKILGLTAREAKDVPGHLAAPLLAAIVDRADYPRALFDAVIRRIRATREVRFQQAAILKATLNRNHDMEVTVALDPARTDPAYLIGRLFAAVEKTQRDALPGIGTTLADSFYGSASATPRAVLPRLLRLHRHHLAKLEPPGRRVNRERLVQEIVASLDSFPAQLDLTQQGLFAIGYYHQMQSFYTKTEPGEAA